jgi:hypothetical protein
MGGRQWPTQAPKDQPDRRPLPSDWKTLDEEAGRPSFVARLPKYA